MDVEWKSGFDMYPSVELGKRREGDTGTWSNKVVQLHYIFLKIEKR